MSELKPCPFCGGEAELWHNKTWDYVVRCTNKGCAARTRQYHENSNGAVDAWNTRAATPGAGECEMQYATEGMKRGWWVCSECGEASDTINACGGRTPPNYCGNCGKAVKR